MSEKIGLEEVEGGWRKLEYVEKVGRIWERL